MYKRHVVANRVFEQTRFADVLLQHNPVFYGFGCSCAYGKEIRLPESGGYSVRQGYEIKQFEKQLYSKQKSRRIAAGFVLSFVYRLFNFCISNCFSFVQKRLFNQIDESECAFERKFAVHLELERNFLIHFLCPVEV